MLQLKAKLKPTVVENQIFLFLPVLHTQNECFKDLLFWKSIIASRGLKRIIWM